MVCSRPFYAVFRYHTRHRRIDNLFGDDEPPQHSLPHCSQIGDAAVEADAGVLLRFAGSSCIAIVSHRSTRARPCESPNRAPERWQSGRLHRTRNAAYSQGYRGFESPPLRQYDINMISCNFEPSQEPACEEADATVRQGHGQSLTWPLHRHKNGERSTMRFVNVAKLLDGEIDLANLRHNIL